MGCQHGEDCSISCSSSYSGCSSSYISPETSSYLTVICSASLACQSSTIICPIGGCHIKCSDYNSCQSLNIHYYGVKVDEGKIIIDCLDDHTCSGMVVNANNASSVTLTARGKYGFYHSNLHVQWADYVSIKCVSGMIYF